MQEIEGIEPFGGCVLVQLIVSCCAPRLQGLHAFVRVATFARKWQRSGSEPLSERARTHEYAAVLVWKLLSWLFREVSDAFASVATPLFRRGSLPRLAFVPAVGASR